MDVLKLINIKQPVLLLKTLSDGNLGVIDAQNTLRIVSSGNYGVIDGFKAHIPHSRFVGTHVDIASDRRYSVSVVPGSSQAAVFSIAEKALTRKIGRHKGEIESVAIDAESRYCVTCGQDGKGYVWVLRTGRLAFAMPPHTDFISAVAFNENGQWIATGGYDRLIHLLNLGTMKHPFLLRGHAAPIVRLLFLPGMRLLSADREGDMIVWDVPQGRMIKRLPRMSDEIHAVAASEEGRFVFVGTKLGYVGLYDLESFETVTHRYIKESEPIGDLAFLASPYRLAVGTGEGNIRVYALFGNEEEHFSLLREHRYKEFYAQLETNPMIRYSPAYAAAERAWQEVVEQARVHLEKNEREKARELFSRFAGISQKNAFITHMLRDYEKYTQFRQNAEQERFALAYSLAGQFPVFKETEIYRTMEAKWRKAFARAQELIVTPGGDEKAREVLSPYRGISAKTVLIQQLFDERRMYDYLKKVVQQRDFAKFFDLIKQHPFLKEFGEYKMIMEQGGKLYQQVKKAYAQGDYATVQNGGEVLSLFPRYAEEVQKMAETIKVQHLFKTAVAGNSLAKAFEYLGTYPYLAEMPEARELIGEWNRLLDEAQRHAAKGDAAAVLETFEAYRTVKEKYAAIGTVMAQAYRAQIEAKISQRASRELIENAIRRYIALFGIDEGILFLFYHDLAQYQPSSLDLQSLRAGSLESWTPLMRVDDITAA